MRAAHLLAHLADPRGPRAARFVVEAGGADGVDGLPLHLRCCNLCFFGFGVGEFQSPHDAHAILLECEPLAHLRCGVFECGGRHVLRRACEQRLCGNVHCTLLAFDRHALLLGRVHGRSEVLQALRLGPFVEQRLRRLVTQLRRGGLQQAIVLDVAQLRLALEFIRLVDALVRLVARLAPRVRRDDEHDATRDHQRDPRADRDGLRDAEFGRQCDGGAGESQGCQSAAHDVARLLPQADIAQHGASHRARLVGHRQFGLLRQRQSRLVAEQVALIERERLEARQQNGRAVRIESVGAHLLKCCFELEGDTLALFVEPPQLAGSHRERVGVFRRVRLETAELLERRIDARQLGFDGATLYLGALHARGEIGVTRRLRRQHALGVRRHVGQRRECFDFRAALRQFGAAPVVLLEPLRGVARAQRDSVRFECAQAGAQRQLFLVERGNAFQRAGHFRVGVFKAAKLRGLELAHALEPLHRVLDGQRRAEHRRVERLEGGLERLDRLDRAGVTRARVGGAFEPRLQRGGTAVLLELGHDIRELALAPERALGELVGIKTQQRLADREPVLLGGEVRRHVLATVVEHLDRAAREVARDRVLLAIALDVELEPVGAAIPRTPAFERRDGAAVAPRITVQSVEPRDDAVQQAGLAALVLVDHQIQARGVKVPLAAQQAEAIRLEPEEFHASTSSGGADMASHAGVTSRSRKASSP